MTDSTTTPPSPHWSKPWTYLPLRARSVLTFALIIGGLLAIVFAYQKSTAYAQKVVVQRSEKIGFSFALANPPAWLPKSTLSDIRSQVEKYSNHDETTYRRFQNPLDKDILKNVAEFYTGKDAQGVDRQTLASNAWIKRVLEVRRVIRQDRTEQWIEITAEYRRIAAVVAVPVDAPGPAGKRLTDPKTFLDPAAVPALRYYLIDGEQVRLPGEFAANPIPGKCVVLYGIAEDTPAPGSAWTSPEVAEGLKLAAILSGKNYASFSSQIALINLANFGARAAGASPLAATDPQITFRTTFNTTVYWGRPLGQESFYEVQPGKKLTTLADTFAQFKRIDAGRDWADVRYEDLKVKALARPDPAPATQPTHPRPRLRAA